jgi:hypothetical protein
MSKIKTFIRAFFQSTTNPSYYSDILKAPMKFSIKYVLLLTLFLTLIGTVALSIQATRAIQSLNLQIDKQGRTLFPPELVIKIENGHLSTNHKGPLVITLPLGSDPTRNILIDPDGKESDMSKGGAYILANKDALFFHSEGTTRTYSYKDLEIKNVTINQVIFHQALSITKHYLSILPQVLPAILFVTLFILILVVILLKTLFYSLITYIIIKIMSVTLGYKKAFQITAHAITPILLLQILEMGFGFVIPIPLFYPILFAILMIIILRETIAHRPKKK